MNFHETGNMNYDTAATTNRGCAVALTMNENYACSAQAQQDAKYIRRTLELASRGKGRVQPNPMVGCVIVKNSRTVAEGYHRYFSGPHAEIVALRKAGKKNISLKKATMYINLEPCCHYKKKTPPCVPEIIKSGIKRVVMSMKDPNPQVQGKGIKKLQTAGIECIVGMNEQQAKELNKFYIKLITKRMPYVILKWAMSLDGKIATKTGNARWISCDESRDFVHRIRSEVDAVLVGIGTVLKDDPELTVRLGQGLSNEGVYRRGMVIPGGTVWLGEPLSNGGIPDNPISGSDKIMSGKYKNPVRVIVDPELKILKIFPGAKVLGPEAKTIICHSVDPLLKSKRAGLKVKVKLELLNKNNCKTVYFKKDKNNNIKFKQIMRFLAGTGISSVLIEGGGDTNARALKSEVVDEVFAFISPKIIGGRSAISPVEGDGVRRISQALLLKDIKIKMLGRDFLISGRVGK